MEYYKDNNAPKSWLYKQESHLRSAAWALHNWPELLKSLSNWFYICSLLHFLYMNVWSCELVWIDYIQLCVLYMKGKGKLDLIKSKHLKSISSVYLNTVQGCNSYIMQGEWCCSVLSFRLRKCYGRWTARCYISGQCLKKKQPIVIAAAYFWERSVLILNYTAEFTTITKVMVSPLSL